MKENNKTIVIVIIVLIVIILGLGGYIAIDKLLINNQKECKTTIVMDNTMVDLNSFYNIEDSLKSLDNAFNEPNTKYFGYIYSQKKLTVSNFNEEAALYASIYEYLVRNSADQRLHGAVVKSNFERLFGKNLEYKPTRIDCENEFVIEYNPEEEAYTYKLNPIQKAYSNGYKTINIKTDLEEDKIILTRKVFYAEYESDNNGATYARLALYKDKSKSKLIGKISLKGKDINYNEVIAKYESSLNTYYYTFVDNQKGNYTFYSIERK